MVFSLPKPSPPTDPDGDDVLGVLSVGDDWSTANRYS
jgi:hypothetical protein